MNELLIVPEIKAPISPLPGDARAYRRAHAGKLMVVLPKDPRALVHGDFFRLADVGTHPAGLVVTGIFAGDRRSHMMADVVRDATAGEIALAQELEEQELRKRETS